MKNTGKYIGLGFSILLFIAVVPYSVMEWFDDRIPYSPILYLFSTLSVILLAYNLNNLRRKD